MISVRAVIVEDEPLGRRVIRNLAGDAPWLTIAGEAADGRAAVDLIEAVRPDLVFMDVELPECSGLRVLEQISTQPAIVFVTAYDRYAISAFELEAIDYLVKPFGSARFSQTLRRIQSRFLNRTYESSARQASRVLTRLFLRKRQQIVQVGVVAVSRLAAEGDYTRVFVGGTEYLSQMGLGEFAARLDARRFVRIHRSMIVNLDHVRSMHRLDDRRFRLRMSDGLEVVTSRAGSERLRRIVRINGGSAAL